MKQVLTFCIICLIVMIQVTEEDSEPGLSLFDCGVISVWLVVSGCSALFANCGVTGNS